MSSSLQGLTANTPLPYLGPHLPTLVLSAIGFTAVQVLTHKLGPRWVANWSDMDKRTRRGVGSHTVSMIHALIAIPLAFQATRSRILREDPVFGYDPMVGHVLAISSGYFLWDTVDSLINSTIGFVVHGAACLAVFLFSFAPFLAGFGAPFLLWELSTPFLNVHWFMDKLGYSTRYPTVYLVNALWFMLVFFLARICYGGYNSVVFFQTMWQERARIPLHLQLIYCSGNLALNGLNWLWFSKMFAKMIARISGDDEPKVKGNGARASSGSTNSGKKLNRRESSGGGIVGEKRPLLAGQQESLHGKTTGQGEQDETLSLPVQPPSPVVARAEGEAW